MKKFFLTLGLLSTFICAYAQKDYVYLKEKNNALSKFGETLNDFLSKGYFVEKMSATSATGTRYVSVILSNNSKQNIDIKSYVFIEERGGYFILSGDVPSGVETKIYMERRDRSEVLNSLSKHGFQVDFFNIDFDEEYYLLSKKKTGDSNSLKSLSEEKDDLKEVARYNLKGLPVSNSYKGVQIIVYSNYTTKIVKNNR